MPWLHLVFFSLSPFFPQTRLSWPENWQPQGNMLVSTNSSNLCLGCRDSTLLGTWPLGTAQRLGVSVLILEERTLLVCLRDYEASSHIM